LKDFGGTPPASQLPLQLCEGDCDNDRDCAGVLKCFQRDGLTGLTPVPGCSGSGISGYDYCIYPELKDFGVTPPASQLPLELCEGDCDNDSDCAFGLNCFERNGLTPVPGCSGNGKSNYDYCIYPELKDFGITPPASQLPLQLCEGDCDYDSDCAGGLKCFYRNDLTPVPGCSGSGISGYDYCISPPQLFPKVNAIDYDVQSGTQVLVNNVIGWFDNNDYLTYNSLNFGPSGTSKRVQLRYSKGSTNGGKLELRIGGPTGTLIGEYSPWNTFNWSVYRTVYIEIDDVIGIQDLTLVGRKDYVGGVMNIDWFELSA
jgi:hypothetical protein